ncbi:MAG: MgtC/SapB family protein [Chloroflexi bacterium]|nr:MgtC/SapB family protein [Chloroflexota bacterium]
MTEVPIATFTAHDTIVMIARLAAAFGCGIALGFERRRRIEHPAGIRTMALITVGAAVFTLVSIFGFEQDADHARVAAQVVTGVGFLGAGVMFLGRQRVHNLTTAAAIWLAAAVGVAAGAGLLVLAGITTIFVTTLLIVVKPRSRSDGSDE